MANTSLAAYAKLKDSAKHNTQQGKVLYAVMTHGDNGMSRRQIMRATGLEINAVCGRVKELLDDEVLVVGEELGECPSTGQAVELIFAVYEEEDVPNE